MAAMKLDLDRLESGRSALPVAVEIETGAKEIGPATIRLSGELTVDNVVIQENLAEGVIITGVCDDASITDAVILGRVCAAQVPDAGGMHRGIDIQFFEGGVLIAGKIIRKIFQLEGIKEALCVFQNVING